MILNELYDRSPAAYQDVTQDNSQPRLGDLRKTKQEELPEQSYRAITMPRVQKAELLNR